MCKLAYCPDGTTLLFLVEYDRFFLISSPKCKFRHKVRRWWFILFEDNQWKWFHAYSKKLPSIFIGADSLLVLTVLSSQVCEMINPSFTYFNRLTQNSSLVWWKLINYLIEISLWKMWKHFSYSLFMLKWLHFF